MIPPWSRCLYPPPGLGYNVGLYVIARLTILPNVGLLRMIYAIVGIGLIGSTVELTTCVVVVGVLLNVYNAISTVGATESIFGLGLFLSVMIERMISLRIILNKPDGNQQGD